ncbi:MAG TPA: hypothetical protein ENF41_02295 [Candidatus Bathyarchaeota archaeon]|nr:hypothetical protein [Candidatus Bathyarchaeota archaeon]
MRVVVILLISSLLFIYSPPSFSQGPPLQIAIIPSKTILKPGESFDLNVRLFSVNSTRVEVSAVWWNFPWMGREDVWIIIPNLSDRRISLINSYADYNHTFTVPSDAEPREGHIRLFLNFSVINNGEKEIYSFVVLGPLIKIISQSPLSSSISASSERVSIGSTFLLTIILESQENIVVKRILLHFPWLKENEWILIPGTSDKRIPLNGNSSTLNIDVDVPGDISACSGNVVILVEFDVLSKEGQIIGDASEIFIGPNLKVLEPSSKEQPSPPTPIGDILILLSILLLVAILITYLIPKIRRKYKPSTEPEKPRKKVERKRRKKKTASQESS